MAKPASPYYRWIVYEEPIAAPTGTFQMKSGKRSLADFKGKAVILNLWATWCVPCLKELPTLDKLEKKYADRGLVVLPLSLDDHSYKELRKFFDDGGIDLPHLAVDKKGKVASELSWNALPITFLINRKGEITSHFSGATNWLEEKHVPHLERALAN